MLSRVVKPSGRAKLTGRWVFACALIFSGVAHLVFTPAMALVGALAWLTGSVPEQPARAEPLRAIEIDIGWIEPETDGSAAEDIAPATEGGFALQASPDQSTTKPKQKSARKKQLPKKLTKKNQANKPPNKSPSKRREKKKRTKPEGIGHPVASSGLKSKAVDSNATVNLLLAMEPIRSHPLGPRIGQLLVNLPQWQSFLGSAQVNPVDDFDRILVVGPEMSRSAEVVVVVQHHLKPSTMHRAIDVLVKRPPAGRWLKTKPAAALARADRAERLFVLSAPGVLVIAPPSLQGQLLETPIEGFPAPASGAAVVAHIKNPRQALARLRIALPESLEWIRLGLTAKDNGGALLELAAEDATPSAARRHALELSVAINAITNPDLGALGALIGLKTIAFLNPLKLVPRGKKLSGSIDITPRQLGRILAYLEGWVSQRAARRKASSTPRRRKIDNSPVP